MQDNGQLPHIAELFNQAVRYHQSGNIEQAAETYEKILAQDPGHSSALHLLGVVAHQSGRHDTAIELMEKAIEADSGRAFYFLCELGNVYKNIGTFDRAIQNFEKAIAQKPDYAEACYGLGAVFKAAGKPDETARQFRKALQLNLGHVPALIEMGEFFESGDGIREAIACYQKVSASDAVDSALVFLKLGILHGKLDELDGAITCFQKSLELTPDSAGTNYNLGLALQKQHRFDEAILSYQQTLTLNPDHAGACVNIGILRRQQGDLDAAHDFFAKALRLAPDHADAYINMGVLCQQQGDLDAAIDYYSGALRLEPDHALACGNMALAVQKQHRADEATQWFEKALAADPEYADCLSHFVYHLKETCDWEKLAIYSHRLDVLNQQAIEKSARTAETPFLNLTRYADPACNHAVARSWADDLARQVPDTRQYFSFAGRRGNRKKITIGYLSNNFGNHPVTHLMQNLFALHDRNHFAVNCYSYGQDDGSRFRKKIENDCDRFVDLFHSDHLDSARCINEDEVDILIDLVGHTARNRMAICAYRPAPVQVSYLGFPGTSGADFLDYIITDRVVTPAHDAQHYSEKFVYMPHSYQIYDDSAAKAQNRIIKADSGLPDNGFIFCSFNRPYKIDPVMFDSWMKILQTVEGSVLWLLSGGDVVERNLRRAAQDRNVDPARLVFAGMMPLGDHLERLKLADLALDTRVYSGGATTSLALMAGIPLITLQGGHFLSRMAASTLMAAGLPELITPDLQQYEALATSLATNPAALRSIALKIGESRLKAPIFDTSRFVQDLEKAYRRMWEIFLSGDPPRQIN